MSNKSKPVIHTFNKIAKPHMYSVTMHNDDYTTMDFVILVLIKIFHKDEAEANTIMMDVHKSGKSVVGIYTYDLAVTKKIMAQQMSAERGFPLKVTVEEVIQ